MAIACFFVVIAITLVITYVAARRTKSTEEFYVAGRSIGGTMNGFAIAGDFVSAATLLGTSALLYVAGFDATLYLVAPLVAFTVFLFAMSDRLVGSGHYTFTDILCARLDERPVRIVAATTALVSAIMYLMVQVVGAGALLQVLFDIPYRMAVAIVGALMIVYVAVGGMLATTWVQITKAALLITGVTILALLVLTRVDFDIGGLLAVAPDVLRIGGLQLSTLDSVSLLLGLSFGLVGSPHLLMRFFTVPTARAARTSAAVALGCVSYVNLLIVLVIGAGAVFLVRGIPAYHDAAGVMVGGANMVSIHLSHAVGGEMFLGIMSAVAFATILAVVAGLTLASVSAVSHDLYAKAWRRGRTSQREELLVLRIATVLIGAIVVVLGIAFEGQNIAYLVSLALSVAASTNFPMLILTMYWRGFTTRGAIVGGITGLVTTIALVTLSPAVWVTVLGYEHAVFPSEYPALYSMAAGFGAMWFFSTTDRSARARIDKEAFGR